MPETTSESNAPNPESPPTILYNFQGKQERAMEVSFEVKAEGWSTYTLQDGTAIKLKNVTSRILKLLDRLKEDGSPFYVLEGVAVVTTIPPEPSSGSTGEK